MDHGGAGFLSGEKQTMPNAVDLDPHAQPPRISIDYDNWEDHLNVKCRQVIIDHPEIS